jgi:hypothetical protein
LSALQAEYNSGDLKQNMVRFGYVLRKLGITSKGPGITAHGLRHVVLIEEYIAITGQDPPLRGGGRASAAYLGAVLDKKKCGTKGSAGGGAADGDAAA